MNLTYFLRAVRATTLPALVALASIAPAHAEGAAVADCSNLTQISNVPFPSQTVVTAGGTEVGQSFLATCDGLLTTVVFGRDAGGAASGTLRIYSGAGTLGTELGTQAFTTPAVGGSTEVGISLSTPVTVVSGQTYTYFLDLTSGSFPVLFRPAPSTYAGGTTYATFDGNPANANAGTSDQYFRLFFEPAPVTVAETVFDGPGWRLLAPPVQDVTVDDLAGINLVQGIAAGATAPAQYPAAGANLFTRYVGPTAADYLAPVDTDAQILPGTGFFWYWYDSNAGPFAGGTSQGYELSTFSLDITGSPRNTTTTRTLPVSTDDFYMIGNPFAETFEVAGISVTNPGVTLSSVFSAYNPAAGTYVSLLQSNPGLGGASDEVTPWQGLFAELTDNPSSLDPAFSFNVANVSAGTPPFYGKSATQAASISRLRLTGTTASGAAVTDEAAIVRFMEGATPGWDQHDASKLTPPQQPYALIAPVGERNGAPYRLSVNSLPELAENTAVTVPMAFTATEAGTFEIAWGPGLSVLPEGWGISLTDRVAGVTRDLTSGESYSFAAEAGDWAERFDITIAPSSVVATDPTAAPQALALTGAAPNPFGYATTVRFELPAAGEASLTVVDLLGREVATLADGEMEAGAHDATWLAEGVPAGVYVVRLQAGADVQTLRVTVMR
jgi:hypothetical protein